MTAAELKIFRDAQLQQIEEIRVSVKRVVFQYMCLFRLFYRFVAINIYMYIKEKSFCKSFPTVKNVIYVHLLFISSMNYNKSVELEFRNQNKYIILQNQLYI